MDNLLDGFDAPAVMDIKVIIARQSTMSIRDKMIMNIIKVGKRTFNDNPDIHTPRTDLYQKMIQVDPSAPTEAERETEAITKCRYLSFRDGRSTTTGLCKYLCIAYHCLTT